MITSCPECGGKLSSAAPSCPHCGYDQSAKIAAAAPAPNSKELPPLPELVLPSAAAVRGAARRTWSEWVRSSVWPLLIGSIILVVAIGLMILVFLIANRLNQDNDRHSRTGRGDVAWR